MALAAVASAGRTLPEMSERQVLELARRRLAPEQTLEQFVLACVESGGVAPLPTFDGLLPVQPRPRVHCLPSLESRR